MLRTATAAAAALLAATLLLAGCSLLPFGGGGGGSTGVTCYPEGADARGELGDPIDCSEPHGFELVGRVEATGLAEVIAAVGEEELFADPESAAWDDFFDGFEGCNGPIVSAFGLDDINVGGVDGVELGLIPGGMYYTVTAVPELDLYRAGDTRVRCLVHWFDPGGTDAESTIPDGSTLADFTRGAFGAQSRECFVRHEAGGDYDYVNCVDAHNGQYLLYFNGIAALGEDWIAGFPPSGPRDSYSELDEFCIELIDAVYPGLLDTAGWQVWGDKADDIFPASWEDYGYDGEVDPEGSYVHYCGMLSEESVSYDLVTTAAAG